MNILDKEHYELMQMFEKDLKNSCIRGRLDKEDKENWNRGIIYQDGNINQIFLLYRKGYAFGKAL